MVVDLEQRTTKKFVVPQEPSALRGVIIIRFYGKYLAARIFKNKQDSRRLFIFDIENDEVVYDKIVHSNTWCISNDRVRLIIIYY